MTTERPCASLPAEPQPCVPSDTGSRICSPWGLSFFVCKEAERLEGRGQDPVSSSRCGDPSPAGPDPSGLARSAASPWRLTFSQPA